MAVNYFWRFDGDFDVIPDFFPPTNVLLECGVQDNKVLLSWENPEAEEESLKGGRPSRAQLTGYAVYADGFKVCDIDTPTGQLCIAYASPCNYHL